MKPTVKPANPNFSSGPCSKRPGYKLENLRTETLGRSHRSAIGKKALKDAIEKSKELLGLPEGYRLGIVPASDTGAVEMFLWSALGAKPVDVCYWESFGKGWMADICNELKIEEVRKFEAPYGELPDLSQTNPDHDIVFTWNGTTSGVRVDNADWISDDRTGLTICDATSAAFAMDLPWEKLDVVTYSWQKSLGGEGAHGVIILSPRAVERLETFNAPRPLPKIFRMAKGGKLIEGIFSGATINTPSLLCVEDYNNTLEWVESIGGLSTLVERCNANAAVIEKFVAANEWIHFLAKED
ncbi:MAG: phosphoserine transaminase, partial [Lentisphaeraceae bacterium]|nr:phosphoserine transaminase [Lentisphaeraceae bacterium]